MIAWTQIALIGIAGVCFGAGAWYTLVGFRPGADRQYAYFGGMCLAVSVYTTLTSVGYGSDSADDWSRILDRQVIFASLFNILFVSFIGAYTAVRHRPLQIVLTVAYAVCAVLSVKGVYSSVTGVRFLELPWGETITQSVEGPNPWMFPLVTGSLILFAYAILASIRQYRRGEKREGKSLLAAVILLQLSVFHDAGIDAGLWRGLHLIEIGFLGLVTIMGLRMSRELIRFSAVHRSLVESESRFREMAELLPNVIFEVDPDGRIVYTNRAGLQNFSYAPEDLDKLNGFDLFAPEQRQVALERAALILQGEGLGPHEYTLVRSDGSRFPALVQVAPVHRNQRIVGLRGVVVDITEKKAFEAQLQQASKMEAIGTLAGGIAHDFNNILAAMIGFSDLALEKAPLGSDQARYIERVLSAGDRAKNLVRQILTFSRHRQIDRRPLLLSAAVGECMALLRASMPALQIRLDVASDAVVRADETEMHQVVMNLITNAAHSIETDKGTIDISIESVQPDAVLMATHPGIARGSHVCLRVRDNGHGIPPENLGRIFDPFFTTRDQVTGTGLGLSVVYGIVRDIGGEIAVTSQVGVGSTFSVYLPESDDGVADARSAARGSAATGTGRLLFVDDEPMLVDLGKRMLSRLGYQVSAYQDPVEAIAAFRAAPERYDLVITDLTMPAMSGVQVAAEIIAARPDIPVILCTGYADRIDDDEARGLGIRLLLRKPLTMTTLAEKVRDSIVPLTRI